MTDYILLDCSASMFSPVVKREMQSRSEVMETELAPVVREFPRARVIAFGYEVRELEGIQQEDGLALPPPSGGTPLHTALQLVRQLGLCTRLIIYTDGIVDDAEGAIAAMQALAPVTVHTFHIGDETDKVALAFLRRLFLAGGTGIGSFGARDLSKPGQLTDEVRLLLTDQKTREMGS